MRLKLVPSTVLGAACLPRWATSGIGATGIGQ